MKGNAISVFQTKLGHSLRINYLQYTWIAFHTLLLKLLYGLVTEQIILVEKGKQNTPCTIVYLDMYMYKLCRPTSPDLTKLTYVFEHAGIVSVAPVARYIAEEIAENTSIVITEHVHSR